MITDEMVEAAREAYARYGQTGHLRTSPPSPGCALAMLTAALSASPAVGVKVKALEWQDMATAPKDGSMLRLLVNPSPEEFTAFDDSLTPFETIGFNNLDNTEDDRWEFAGWDWSQDCFITGRGEVIGWAPFAATTEGSTDGQP